MVSLKVALLAVLFVFFLFWVEKGNAVPQHGITNVNRASNAIAVEKRKAEWEKRNRKMLQNYQKNANNKNAKKARILKKSPP